MIRNRPVTLLAGGILALLVVTLPPTARAELTPAGADTAASPGRLPEPLAHLSTTSAPNAQRPVSVDRIEKP